MTKTTILQPDLILGATVVNLSPEILQKYQLQGLILDVDETLLPLKETQVSVELEEWVEEIREVAELFLVSNNISSYRIGRIAKSLDLPYISAARKPSRRSLRQAVEQMNLPVEAVAMVGDRLFTDVLAGNRLGMFTILVEPMINPARIPNPISWRNFEVWISQFLGVSLSGANTSNSSKVDKSS